MEQLMQKLKDAGLIDDIGYIVLERYDGGMQQAVSPETFQEFFGTTNFSYAALVAADKGKGYTRFFDQWKQAGVLT